LAKGEIARLIMSYAKEIFYHIRQVAARIAKLVLGGAFETPILGRGGRRGQRWYHQQERWWFPIGSPLWPLHYLSVFGRNLPSNAPNAPDAQINSEYGGHFGAKFEEEGVDQCNAIWKRHAVVCKRYRVDIFCRLNTMHEHGRQTNRKRDHGTVKSISIGESLLAMPSNNT